MFLLRGRATVRQRVRRTGCRADVRRCGSASARRRGRVAEKTCIIRMFSRYTTRCRDAHARDAMAQAKEATRDDVRSHDKERWEERTQVNREEGGQLGDDGRRNCAP